MFQYAFVEKTEKGRWAVKRKEGKEYEEEIIVLGVFDDEKVARDYRDEQNRRLFPAGHDRNPEPAPGLGYAKSDELPTEDLLGKDIFAAGTWTDSHGRKKTYTNADLDDMVATFNSMKSTRTPPFKIDHSTGKQHQAFVGAPAIGWVTNMWRSGTKLVADFARVPKKVAQLIRAGSYSRISPEVHHNFKDEATGKTYRLFVSAAALLGAKLPAMNTIDAVHKLFGVSDKAAIADYYDLPDWAEEGHAQTAEMFAAFEPVPEGGEEMDPEEVKKLVADSVAAAVKPIEDKATQFSSGVCEALGIEPDADPVAAIKTMKSDKEKSDTANAEKDAAEFSGKVDALILKAKTDGKLLPAAEPGIRLTVEMLRKNNGEPLEFSIGDGKTETVKGDALEWLKSHFEAQPVVNQHGKEMGPVGAKKNASGATLSHAVVRNLGSDGVPVAITGTNIQERINEYQSAHKCDFMTAWEATTGLVPPREPEAGEYSIDEKTGEMHRSV